MSSTISILSALLLLLISGSTEGEQRMDPVALLRQTLRYWRKIYKTYHEEVALGYCWADYLLEISDELSTNLSTPSLTATGDRNTTNGTTKSQRNPFSQNAMADTMMPLRETRKEKHLREKRSCTTTESVISKITNDFNEHRIISRVKMIQDKWIIDKVLPITSNNEKRSKIDGSKRIIPMIDLYIQKKRRAAFSIIPKLFQDQQEILRDNEFSSCDLCTDTVDTMPNPKHDDKINFKSIEENKHRKVLYSNHHDSLKIKDTFVLQNLHAIFERKRSLDNHPFQRQYSQLRERNSKVDELSSDSRMPKKNRGIKRDPERDRVPLNNYGSFSLSRLQFRRINDVIASVRGYTGIVKLTNFVESSLFNSTRALNSKMSREKLFRDSLLLPREKRIRVVERSSLESRENGREAVERNAFSRFNKMGNVGESDAKTRRYHQQPRVEKRSRIERDVSAAPGMVHPFSLSRFERSYQQMFYENRVLFPTPIVSKGSRSVNDDRIRAVKSAHSSLSRVGRFIKNYENSTNEFVKNLRSIALQARQLSLRSTIITVFKTLGIFVQVGRQIMDIVESNAILACTKEYLWTKIIRWIDE